MTGWRRLLGLLATMMLGVGSTLFAATPARATIAPPYVAPIWVLYCGGCVGTVAADGSPTSIQFGAIVSAGVASAVRVTVDTTTLDASKVQVVGVTGPCAFGPVIVCDFGDLQPGNHTADLILKHQPGGLQGVSAGQVTVTTSSPSDSTRSIAGAVSIAFGPATNISFSASASPAGIGEISTVTVAMRNQGPSALSWASAGFRLPAGTAFVGGAGCVLTSDGVGCRVENLLPGSTATPTAQLRVDSCAATQPVLSTGWAISIEDLNTHDNSFTVTIPVTGCGAATGGGSAGGGSAGNGPAGGGSGSGSAAGAGSAGGASEDPPAPEAGEPSPTVSPEPTSSPTGTGITTTAAQRPATPAGAPRPATGGWQALLALAGGLIVAAACGTWWARRRRPSEHPLPSTHHDDGPQA